MAENRALAAPLGHRSMKRRLGGAMAWTIYVSLIYAYLFFCMFYGGPFIAYDHVNYVSFLNDPYPFFFEPIYTGVAFVVNAFFDEDLRFPVVFAIFTLPPLWMILSSKANRAGDGRAMMVFACVLTKAFYIGFITQRFLFAELWMAALVIRQFPDTRVKCSLALPGMIHFSALTILPALAWLRSRFTARKASLGIGGLVALWCYLRLFSNFELFGYDYARYLHGESVDGFPLFSVLEMAALAFICKLVLPKDRVPNFVSLIGMVLLVKLIFGDIEVFSRVFQVEIDVIMIMAGMESRQKRSLFFFFGFGFFILQLFFTPTADDVIVFHATALLNALAAW